MTKPSTIYRRATKILAPSKARLAAELATTRARYAAEEAEARALLASTGRTIESLYRDPSTPKGARVALLGALRRGATTL